MSTLLTTSLANCKKNIRKNIFNVMKVSNAFLSTNNTSTNNTNTNTNTTNNINNRVLNKNKHVEYYVVKTITEFYTPFDININNKLVLYPKPLGYLGNAKVKSFSSYSEELFKMSQLLSTYCYPNVYEKYKSWGVYDKIKQTAIRASLKPEIDDDVKWLVISCHNSDNRKKNLFVFENTMERNNNNKNLNIEIKYNFVITNLISDL